MALIIIVSNGIYSPTNPTAHVFMRACFGSPDIAHPAIPDEQLCEGGDDALVTYA